MARRYRVNGHYVIRDKYGQFKKWQNIGRSISADKRSNARKKAKSGYKYQGD